MKKSIRTLICAGLLAGSAAANAASYAFQYTMLDHTLITGSFDGAANGNLVEDISKLAIAINGVAMPNSGNLSTYGTENGFVSGMGRLSFDGLANSLLVFDAPVTDAWTSVFFIGATNGGDTDAINYAFAGLAPNGEGDGDYSASRWSLSTVSAVPEPATYAMLLGGLALIGALARRRNPAA